MKSTILVVDDEEEICDYIRDILEEEGHEVRQAFCGEDVSDLIEKKNIHIAFVDLKLSTAMSGLDVIKLLKDTCPNIKIAAMTGYVDAYLKQQTDQLGVSLFLEKPFRPKDVVKAINKLLGL